MLQVLSLVLPWWAYKPHRGARTVEIFFFVGGGVWEERFIVEVMAATFPGVFVLLAIGCTVYVHLRLTRAPPGEMVPKRVYGVLFQAWLMLGAAIFFGHDFLQNSAPLYYDGIVWPAGVPRVGLLVAVFAFVALAVAGTLVEVQRRLAFGRPSIWWGK